MKKRFLLTVLTILALFLNNEAFAKDFSDDSLKYKLIKTTFDYAPIREGASRNAVRFTHLKSGVLQTLKIHYENKSYLPF